MAHFSHRTRDVVSLSQRKAALVVALLGNGPDGTPAWNLFNEVQATVIGNMLVGRNVTTPERYQRLLDTPKSFYDEEAIDLGARATVHLFEVALAKGGAMRPSFAADFVTALRKGLGARLDAPAIHLRSVVVNVEGDNSPWPTKFRKSIFASSVWTYSVLGEQKMIEKLERFSGLSAVVFATPEQIEKLTPASKVLGLTPNDLTTALGSSAGVLVISKRTSQAYAFVFVARDSLKMEGLIGAFPACTLKPGVCMQIN